MTGRLGICILILLTLACSKPGTERLDAFKDPQGRFEAFFPDKWALQGNYDQAHPTSPVRWVMASGRVRAYDEGHPLGVSFKISRFALDRQSYPGDDRGFEEYKKRFVEPRLKYIRDAQKSKQPIRVDGLPASSRTSDYVHENPIHGVKPVKMTDRSVLVATSDAVYEIELVSVSDLFPVYEPMFEKVLSGFSILGK